MTAYRHQVELALRAAAVTSPTSYAWFGRRARAVPPGATLPARAYLIRALEGTLYRSFYTQGAPVPISGLLPVPAPPIAAFVAALSEANAGRGGWQPGWQIVDTAPEELTVARDGLRVDVRAAECRRTGGSTASLPRAKEHRDASPGFYTAFGDAVPEIGDDDVELRVYFHLTAAGAAPFVASCTRVLNRAGVAFVLKVVDNPAAFVRCDAAVLYLAGFVQCRAASGRRRLRAAPAGDGAGVRQAARRRRGLRRAPRVARRELRLQPLPARGRGHRRRLRARRSATSTRGSTPSSGGSPRPASACRRRISWRARSDGHVL